MDIKKLIISISACLFLLSSNVSAEQEEDCFEKVSRGVFKFNKSFDKAVLRPIAAGYNKLPKPNSNRNQEILPLILEPCSQFLIISYKGNGD